MIFHLFETKRPAKQYIQAFGHKKEQKYYGIEDGGVSPNFYKGNWPLWQPHKLQADDVLCFQGLLRGTHNLKPYLKDHTWYYFDQPYFFNNNYTSHPDFNDHWYRICKNNLQITEIRKFEGMEKRYTDILNQYSKKEHIQEKKWKKDGSYILVIPPSYHTATWFKMDEHKWIKDTSEEIRKYTDREIRVRYKFRDNKQWDSKRNKIPLEEDLSGAFAIVSWHSMTANEALVYGIPSFASKHSPARPMSLGLNELNKIETPYYPDNRHEWLCSLFGSMFRKQEMKSGYAYDLLQEVNNA